MTEKGLLKWLKTQGISFFANKTNLFQKSPLSSKHNFRPTIFEGSTIPSNSPPALRIYSKCWRCCCVKARSIFELGRSLLSRVDQESTSLAVGWKCFLHPPLNFNPLPAWIKSKKEKRVTDPRPAMKPAPLPLLTSTVNVLGIVASQGISVSWTDLLLRGQLSSLPLTVDNDSSFLEESC